MQIKYRSHATAGSKELEQGIPPEWPHVEESVNDSYKLTETDTSAGFVLLTFADWRALRARLQDAYTAWEQQRLLDETLAKEQETTNRRQEIDGLVTDAEAVLTAWETADEKSKGDILRKLLFLIVEALKAATVPVTPIEKPIAK